MVRKYVDSIVVNASWLADEIIRGLLAVNPNYSFDMREARDKTGMITKVEIDVFESLAMKGK